MTRLRKIAGTLLLCLALPASACGASELSSPYKYRTTIPYRAGSTGVTSKEVEFYRINTFVFANAKGVAYTEPPYSDACYRIYPNQGENVAWLEARVILGLLDMHEATGDDAFLEQVVVHADRILNCRLDRRNQQRRPQAPAYDTHRNSSTIAAWPSYSYTYPMASSNHVSHSVHSGFFVYALARFVRFVEEHESEAFREKARQYLPLLKQSLAAFDTERNKDGLYLFPPSAARQPWKFYVASDRYINATNVVQPINMQAAMGLAFLEMQGIPAITAAERRDYRLRAMAIAQYMRARLKRDRKHDSYVWPYWSWKPGDCREDMTDAEPETVTVGGAAECTEDTVEDVSHAAIDVDFAIASVEARLGVFTTTDLRRFANTLMDVVRDPRRPHSPHSSVDGKGAYTDDSADVVYWMGLARYDARVYPWLSDLLNQADIDPRSSAIAGYLPNASGFKYDRDYQAYAAFLKIRRAQLVRPQTRPRPE